MSWSLRLVERIEGQDGRSLDVIDIGEFAAPTELAMPGSDRGDDKVGAGRAAGQYRQYSGNSAHGGGAAFVPTDQGSSSPRVAHAVRRRRVAGAPIAGAWRRREAYVLAAPCSLVKGEGLDGLREGLPAVDLAHADLPGGEQGPEQHGHGLGAGQDGLRLDASAELLVEALDGVGGARRFPLRRREPGEGEQPLPGFFEVVGDGAALQAPFAKERFAAVSTSAAVLA